MKGRTSRHMGLLCTMVAGAGCGYSAHDEIPDDLLAAIEARDLGGATYPEGPYGSQVGDVAPDVCVNAWLDPLEAGFDTDKLRPVCLSDFYAPELEQPGLLLLNTGALWCTACQVEYAGTGSAPSLSRQVAARYDREFRALGVLFQDTERNPILPEDTARWAEAFEVDFPFGLDAPFAMGAFADPLTQPFNMLVDRRTMRIILRLQGADGLWPAVDELLTQ